MTGTLRSVVSKTVRKRKRGESEEDYARRIARLEQKRASYARTKGDGASPKNSVDKTHDSSGAPPTPVIERILTSHNEDLKRAESQIASLVKQIEREREARERLERELANTVATVTARNHVVEPTSRKSVDFSSHGAEIIDLFSEAGQKTSDLEIIEVFDGSGHPSKNVSDEEDNCLISLVDFDTPGHPESNPASPPSSPLKGVSVGRGRATYSARTGSLGVGVAEQSEAEPEQVSLAEASEMLLWVGWVDRARREFPHQPLLARFAERERRVWRDVVASTAEFVGCRDIDARVEAIPFAFELAWTLRYALDSLPACAPVLDVCWRYTAGFMKPQPRAKLGVLSGSESVSAVKRKFQVVLNELLRGTLVVERGAA